MEAVPTPAQGNGSGANTSSVKSDDSSPRQEGRGSPPPNCAICLGTCRNKSFTDSCLHQFCFKCLLTWSKVKAVCPLCKQNFRSIIHNVRSNHQYEEYMVEQSQNEDFSERIDIDNLTNPARQRFRYRTTFTLPRHESIAFQQLLLQHYPMMANVFPSPARRRRLPFAFRRTVYRHNLWARPLADFTGRFRDCTPEFYRYNDTQMHRLVPWLNRELHYLLNENFGHISYVMARMLDLLPQYHINSSEFREAMRRYLGDRTDHFLHELYCFASTPYDLTGYDRNVQYTTNRLSSSMINEINEIISSSDSDATVDSDIVMISSSEPAEPPAGPSRIPPPVYPQNYIPDRSTNNNSVIPIETISQSDSDDDSSEVMVVGYIKPPQDRTPEVVDLLGSDSDVMVQDIPMPEPSQNPENLGGGPLVKFCLKRHRPDENGDTDSEDLSYIPLPPRRKRRHRSNDTATTTDTCRTTPSPTGFREMESRSTSSTSAYTPTIISSSTNTYISDTSSDSSDISDEKTKPPKRKVKGKSSSERIKKKTKKRPSHWHHKEKRNSQNTSKKSSKRKSDSGKGVKSSKKNTDSPSVLTPSTDEPQANLDQPTTSGTISHKKNKIDSSPGRKRLKSVVNVVKSSRSESSSSGNTSFTSNTGPGTSRSDSGDSRSRYIESTTKASSSSRSPNSAKTLNNDTSDSEDDIPLNLTIQKNYQR